MAAVLGLPLSPALGDVAELEALLATEVRAPSRQLERALDAPSSVYTLDAATARALGHETLADMLARLPGAFVGSQGSYSSVGMRGFSRPGDYNARLLMSVDGMRVNDGLYDQALPGLEFPIAAPWIKRVELVSGPAGAVYGSNAVLGVVNVVSFDGADLPGLRLHASLGGERAREIGATWGRHEGDSDWLLGIMAHDRDGGSLHLPELAGPAAPGGWVHGLDGERAAALMLKFRRGAWTVRLGSHRRDKSAATAPFETLAGVPGTGFVDHYHHLDAAYEPHQRSALTPALRLSWVRSRFDGRYVYDDGAGGLLVNADTTASNVVTLDARLSARHWHNHEWTLGAEVRHVGQARQRNADLDPPQVYLDREDHQTQPGLVLRDRWRLSERLTLDLGLRVDHVKAAGWQRSPRLAWVYRPRDGEAWKLMLGRAFRAPTLSERHYADGLTQLPNPGLQAEQAGAAELAWERTFERRWRVSVSGYRQRLSDLIDFVRRPDGLTQYVNLSHAHIAGVELDLEHRPSPAWRWRVSSSLMRARSEGQPLGHAPRWQVKGHLVHQLAPGWSLGLQAQAMSSRPTPRGEVPTWASADLALTRQWQGQQITLRVTNLADAAAFDPGSPENALALLPRPGRRWVLSWRGLAW